MKRKQLSIKHILSENKRMKKEFSRGRALLINTDSITPDKTIQDCINDFNNNRTIVKRGEFEPIWVNTRPPKAMLTTPKGFNASEFMNEWNKFSCKTIYKSK